MAPEVQAATEPSRMRIGDRVRTPAGEDGEIVLMRRELDRVRMGKVDRGRWIAIVQPDADRRRRISVYIDRLTQIGGKDG